MSRKVLWMAVAGSVALHAWMLWPRPATPPAEPASASEQPKALVAVRPMPEPQAEPAPEPAAVPQPAPDPAPASLAAVPEPAPASGPAPVHAPEPAQEPVIVGAPAAPDASDAAEASRPDSEAFAQRLEEFEQSMQSLATQAPVPPSPVEPIPAPSNPIAAPVPAPVPAVAPAPTPVPAPAPRPLALPWLTRRAPQAATDAARPVAAAIATPAPQRPLAARAPSRAAPSRAEAPAAAVLRPVQPYRPISTSWRPQTQPRTQSEATGTSPTPVVAADRSAAPPTKAPTPGEPVARIAWGDPAEASRVLDQGRMLLVCVNEELEVVGALERADGTWRRAASLPSLGAYSNRVRVVDHVGGFSDASRLCREGEHLAVVVPIGVERRMERAMRDAATRAGMLWSRTAACYGRLVPTPTGIEFSVERVEARP